MSLDNGATWTTATSAAGSNTWSVNGVLAGSDTLLARVVTPVLYARFAPQIEA